MRAWVTSLQKRLELLAGFLTGVERFSLRVNERSDDSWWNFKNLTIQIGMKDVEGELVNEIGDLLMKHEIGHVRFTSRSFNRKSLSIPFSLLNIAEDARIESLMETDFGRLHEHSYRKHYLERDNGDDPFCNPGNIGILLRWRRWGVETETHKPPELSDQEYADFVGDWDLCIGKSILSSSTFEVIKHVEQLYLKWKALFDAHASEGGAAGSIEKDAAGMSGQGKEVQTHEPGGKRSDSVKEAKLRALHFKEQWFYWDMGYIEHQAEILRQLLDLKARVDRSYAFTGRRFDPRRIENPPLAPFRKLIESRAIFLLKKMLVVIDGSGSMMTNEGGAEAVIPFQAAAFMAYILSLVFPVDIMVTTSESEKPLHISLKQIDLLQSFTSWGGSENYVSLGTTPSKYSFTLFLTDACVGEDDLRYVQNELCRITKLGAGYVGRAEHRLTEIFPRNFFSDFLDQNIGRMIALFLRRNFTRYMSAA